MSKERKFALFTAQLLKWNRYHNCRIMPWKGEKNPYLVWLSEVILQQTRVEQGLEYYNKFIQAFPSVHDLAAADDERVFKLWEGLGYYSRCRNLLSTARFISFERNGEFPRSFSELLKLKGVGPYTASAIASFAFSLPHAVLDGNVYRVLSRYFGIDTPVDEKGSKELFDKLANELLCTRDPATYNQAIMDFGATVCTPKNPLCSTCIMKTNCTAYLDKKVSLLPAKVRKLKRKQRFFNYLLIESADEILLRKREEKDIWEGLHELVLVESEGKNLERNELKEQFPGYFTGNIMAGEKTVRQQLSHQEVISRFFHIRVPDCPGMEGYTAVSKRRLKDLAFPVTIREFMAGLQDPLQST